MCGVVEEWQVLREVYLVLLVQNASVAAQREIE